MKFVLCILFSIWFILPSFVVGEEVQVKTQYMRKEKDNFAQPSSQELVEIQQMKKVAIDFVLGDIGKKQSLLGKNEVGKTQSLDSILVPFQHESISKIDFLKESVKGRSGSLKAQLYWFSEGYDGSQTVYFEFSKDEQRGWLINWVIY